MVKRKLSVSQRSLSAAFGIGAMLHPVSAFSQSCALCYTQAASAGGRMIQALQSGILILIVPPTLMSVCMIFIVYHKRNQVRLAEQLQGEGARDSSTEW